MFSSYCPFLSLPLSLSLFQSPYVCLIVFNIRTAIWVDIQIAHDVVATVVLGGICVSIVGPSKDVAFVDIVLGPDEKRASGGLDSRS